MKVIKWAFCICLLAACGLLCQSIAAVNREYPNLPARQVSFGESGELQEGVTMRVEAVRWRTMDEARAAYGQEFADQMEEGDIYRIVEAEVGLENKSGQERNIVLYDIYLEKGAYCQGIAPEVFGCANSSPQMIFTLKGHEKRRAVLGYVLYEFQFQKKQWEKIEQLGFCLADTKYPVKTEWSMAGGIP